MLIKKNCVQIKNFIFGGQVLNSHHLNDFHAGVLREEIE